MFSTFIMDYNLSNTRSGGFYGGMRPKFSKLVDSVNNGNNTR